MTMTSLLRCCLALPCWRAPVCVYIMAGTLARSLTTYRAAPWAFGERGGQRRRPRANLGRCILAPSRIPLFPLYSRGHTHTRTKWWPCARADMARERHSSPVSSSSSSTRPFAALLLTRAFCAIGPHDIAHTTTRRPRGVGGCTHTTLAGGRDTRGAAALAPTVQNKRHCRHGRAPHWNRLASFERNTTLPLSLSLTLVCALSVLLLLPAPQHHLVYLSLSVSLALAPPARTHCPTLL